MTRFDLVLVGFGNVARRFVTLLDEQRATLTRERDITARIVGIVTRHHGQQFSSRGIDVAAFAASPVRNPQYAMTVDFVREALRRRAAAASKGHLVVVETTTLDIEHGQPAIDHVRTALAGGARVITTNKGPAAFAYRELIRAAERADRRFLFEGAVMDGVPIFNLVRETLPAV